MRLLSRVKSAVLPRGPAVRTIVSGAFRGISMEIDFQSETQLFLGLFEREIQPWLIKFSKCSNIAVDIGANKGEYAIYFLRNTEAKVVVAFEPDRSSRKLFKHNLALNGFCHNPRLRVCGKYVGSIDDERTCTLDSALSMMKGPFVLKVDVDGAEASVLRGAKRLLGSEKSHWIIETHSCDLESECRALLSGFGFATKIVPNASWRILIPELRPLAHNRWLIASNEPEMIRYLED